MEAVRLKVQKWTGVIALGIGLTWLVWGFWAYSFQNLFALSILFLGICCIAISKLLLSQKRLINANFVLSFLVCSNALCGIRNHLGSFGSSGCIDSTGPNAKGHRRCSGNSIL